MKDKSKNKIKSKEEFSRENHVDLEAIADVIWNKDFGDLAVEVTWSAMHHLKEHPNKTIHEAMCFGWNEWIK